MGEITIPGGSSAITITVSGAQTLAFAQTFAQMVHSASTFVDLSTGQTSTISGSGQRLYYASEGDSSITVPATKSGISDVYIQNAVGETVNGSGHGDAVLVYGAGATATYVDNGGSNFVVFVDGNNFYQGDTASATGTDTIAAGDGFDTILTGAGAALVESGTGNSFIVLNDRAGAGGDTVFLESGSSFVDALGAADTVNIGAGGQFVDGGSNSAGNVSVVLTAGGGGNTILGGASTISIFDAAGNNTITGGSGTMVFVAQAAVADTINGGSGGISLFGAAGNVLALASLAGAKATYVAGSGSETLAGSGSAGNLVLLADNGSDTAAATANSLLVGGSGNDYIQSGEGNETLMGGGGTNEFMIEKPSDSVGARILIGDFGASTNNVVAFGGYTPQQIEAALNAQQTVTGAFGTGVEIQFTDGTTVIFAGVSSLNGHVVS
jgi:Ca2+-binding RTX toxin-like protein